MKLYCCLLLVIAALLPKLSTPLQAEEQANRIFELRKYTAHAGKLKALHARFRNHTNAIFERHGMEPVGYWTPASGDESKNTLIYLLAYPSKAARDKAWDDFRQDPAWQTVLKESRAKSGGALVKKVESTFLAPTDYSRIK
ncbi:MAG TPA: NIPSNAP family protein [Planctomycetaceae bacterium]|nr:NIPSNAP family protein [Blastopirellula sp.]HAY81215.1 NIPSNAP family protein [Planctomycetaceae bacterium]